MSLMVTDPYRPSKTEECQPDSKLSLIIIAGKRLGTSAKAINSSGRIDVWRASLALLLWLCQDTYSSKEMI